MRDRTGQPCGVIIWESKRTKAWSRGWLDKLKEDQRAQGAELAILVSQALPENLVILACTKTSGSVDTRSPYRSPRRCVNNSHSVTAMQRRESGKGEKMEALYHFISSTAFQQQVQGVVEAFSEMQLDLGRERVAMEKLWKKREKLIQRVLQGTAGIHGSLEGIVGQQALPSVKILELDFGEPLLED